MTDLENQVSKIRHAGTADVKQMVELIEARRAMLQTYEPVFWNRAEDAAEKTRAWFKALVLDAAVLNLVAESETGIEGFLIAAQAPVPPVYDPGGATWMIDDFAVAEASQWRTFGKDLIKTAKAQILERGGKQLVVVAPVKDDAQVQLLHAEGLSVASIWLTQTL